MSNQDSRIRNRQLRAYGVFAIAAILLVIIIIAIVGIFTGNEPTDVQNSATPGGVTSGITPTPTATPESTPTPDASPSDEATPTPSTSEKVVRTSGGGSVNLRSQASTSSDVVTTLRTGQTVTVLSEENGWAQVRTQDNQEGYVSSEYLIDRVTGTVVNINSSLNVRATPSATGDRVGTLGNGDTVTVLDTSNSDWTQIVLSNGQVGYCASEYIQTSSAE
mgnify:CR=1 FL=1